MRKQTLALMSVVVLFGAFSVIGCNEREKGQIAMLSDRVDKLQAQNKSYSDQIIELEKINEEMKVELDDKNQQIAKKDAEIDRLNKELSSKPQTVVNETEIIDAPAGWETGKFGAKLTIGSDILFRSGSANLSSAGQRKLAQAVRDIERNYNGWTVRVYGYTDSDPIRKSKWKDNLQLSANRAMAVTRYMTSHGLDADDVETIGMGSTHYIASNKTRSGKAKNRRVEIVVVRPGK